MTRPAMDPAPDDRAALLTRRLELDNEDLRAENARLKGSIAQRQEEIQRRGEHAAELLEQMGALAVEIVELKRGLADTQAALAARVDRLRPIKAMVRRLRGRHGPAPRP